MSIDPIVSPRLIAQPAVASPDPPSLVGAREGPLRFVVWFSPELALPEDEIACTPAAADMLFGPGIGQRLLITTETAWLQRLLPGPLADELDQSPNKGDESDIILSTPFSHLYLLRLSGGMSVAHVCEVLESSANVRLIHPEATLIATAPPTQYKNNPVFKSEQEYLRKDKGINAEPAWAKGYTGAGIRAGVIDTGTGPSSMSPHALNTTGIFCHADDAAVGIGAAPEAKLEFQGATTVIFNGQESATLASVSAALASILKSGQLQAGDVLNMSLAVSAGLNYKEPYAEYQPLMQSGIPGYKMITQEIGGNKRPSGVVTQLPLEFDPALLKFISALTTKGITVVEGAGNGLAVLCEPKSAPKWIVAIRGANLTGPWLAGEPRTPLDAFRSGLAKKAVHSLDRATPSTFADGGGIIVAGGQFSPSRGGMIDNIQLNHGNRIDCYVNTPSAQSLGFTAPPPPPTAGAPNVGGTSLCAPAIAGAAAVVQGISKAQFQATLKPAIVRALLSDPDLGTPTISGSAVGVMPDLERLMQFLEKPNKIKADLVIALQAQQKTSAARVKAAIAAAPGTFAHDPYTVFTGTQGAGTWQPMPLASESDVFSP